MEKYKDRTHAGIVLANYLKEYKNNSQTMVLALPRGGVPIGYEIAKALSLPLDIFIVRKLGVPGHEELAMGAIASGGVVTYNEVLTNQLNISPEAKAKILLQEQKELIRREHLYRQGRPFPTLNHKTIILVDDGIATGYSIRAAIHALKKLKPLQIIIAVPVAAHETYEELANLVDKIICPLHPVHFNAVGMWYEAFPQTSDEEVIELLEASGQANKDLE